MIRQNKFTVSHAPFWHDGDRISVMNYNIMLAALPAALVGIARFGAPALGVISLSVSFAMIWEALFNLASRRGISIGDGNAAVIGLLLGMMLPATVPWWGVVIGTFVAVVIGKMIYGGIGANPFNPTLIDAALLTYDFPFTALAPLAALKHQGPSVVDLFSMSDLILGKQVGGIGSVCGLALIGGGIYLILRGYIRWEIPVSYIAGIIVTALVFNMVHPDRFAGPLFHLFTGFTLLGAFFLATETSSSPVNAIPMLIYGTMGGVMTILIRNIGAYPDGTIFAILIINLINPLIDKIRPKALGKGVNNA
jgi:electron transport complex protein RnfD